MRIDVSIICPFCGEDHAVEVNLAQYEAWQNGELIQNAMPDLTPTEREQLISGLCPKCQAEMFGEQKLQTFFKKVLTKQPNGAIIKTQKGSERNKKSSEVKPTSQEIAETHSPKVMHIRAGQQYDRVFSEVRRRMEPVGILAHFYLAARARTMRAEFTIIPQVATFVKRKIRK